MGDSIFGAKAVPRACGNTRTQGGVYVENGGGVYGMPIEHFFLCPSIPITDDFGISDVGVTMFKLPGSDTPHIADMIGQKFYPYPVYWIEETRYNGLSRKISQQIASKLTKDSMIFMCHRKAFVNNFNDYPHRFPCPVQKHEDLDKEDMCIGYFYEDIDKNDERVHIFRDGDTVNGKPKIDNNYSVGASQAKVILPSVEFICHLRDKKITPDYHKNGALFAAFPITRLVVVKADDGSHKETYEQIALSTDLIVDEVDK